jgi:hypothetical protein
LDELSLQVRPAPSFSNVLFKSLPFANPASCPKVLAACLFSLAFKINAKLMAFQLSTAISDLVEAV